MHIARNETSNSQMGCQLTVRRLICDPLNYLCGSRPRPTPFP